MEKVVLENMSYRPLIDISKKTNKKEIFTEMIKLPFSFSDNYKVPILKIYVLAMIFMPA